MKETKFEDTEIGRIPEEWEEFPLSSLVTDIADGPFGSNLKKNIIFRRNRFELFN